jgi:hypothetical protein
MTSAKNYSFQRRSLFAGIVLLVAFIGCAPRRPYRAPMPPSSSTAVPREPQTSAPSPPPPPAELSGRPLPQDPRIREQDIGSRAPSATAPATKETREPRKQASVNETRTPVEPSPPAALPPPLPDDSSLLAKITPGVSPQRAASLRLTEEGKKLLDGGEPAKALTPLERTIAIDSTNPYGYFYLAKAQQRLGRYQESLNFLDVAESRLGGEPFWLAEVHALRGENFRALGQLRRAEVSYDYALRLNSGNRTAVEALARMQSETQPASR